MHYIDPELELHTTKTIYIILVNSYNNTHNENHTDIN